MKQNITDSTDPGRVRIQARYPNNRRVLSSLAFLVALIFTLAGCKKQTPLPPTPTVTPLPTATSMPGASVPINDSGLPLAPQIIEHRPGNGQEIPLDGKLLITFDQPMDENKTAAAWQVLDPKGESIQGQVTWLTSKTLQFSPSKLLSPGTTYRAVLNTQATNAGGVSLLDPITFQFNTVGELEVSQVFPADGATEVANNAIITIIFNRPVAPLVIAEQKIALPSPISISPPISGHGDWINTSVYAFRPDKPLRGGTAYTIIAEAGLVDTVGETRLAKDFEWKFNTIAPSINTFVLSDGYTNPENGFSNVPLFEFFFINFNQPMDRGSVETNLSLTSKNGEFAPLIHTWNQDSTQVIITPTQRLALNTKYNLVLNQNTQAAEGGSLSAGLNWNFYTVLPPAILAVSPANGTAQDRFDGMLRIEFVSPMRFDTLKDKVVITPKPEGEAQWTYNDWDWSMNYFGLQPSTRYEVKLFPGMQDIYGNQIDSETTVHFTTAAQEPWARLQMPYGPSIFRIGGPQQFYAAYMNVGSVIFKLYKLSPDTYISLLNGIKSQYQYVPASQDLVWEHQQENTGKLNERVLRDFTPKAVNGDPLPAGFYFLILDCKQISHTEPFLDTRLLVVSNANLAFKTTQTEAMLWLTGLESGKPMQGVSVTVYSQNFQAIGQGLTGADGVLYLNNLPIPEQYSVRYAITDDPQQFAFAASDWGSGVSPYEFGLQQDYYTRPNQPVAYVYTDRPIYRPGQPVYFKGIVRMDDDLSYSLPPQDPVVVTIESYKEKVYEEKLSLSNFGSFDAELLLDKEAALGYYNISVRLPGKEDVIGQVSFTVAEYRKPEFMVNVSAAPTNLLAGETFQVNLGAEYYSGGGVGDSNVDWTLTADSYTFQPSGDLTRFSFTDYDSDAGYFYQYGPPPSEVIAEGKGQTDPSGQLILNLPANLGESKTGRKLTFEATVTDLTGNAVSGRASVIVHRSGVYVGVRSTTYVGMEGEPLDIEVVAVDWNSTPLPGQKVNVDIVERRWYSVQQQDAQGRIQWSSSVEDIPVTSFNDVIVDDKGLATISFTPSKGGIFRAIVTAHDSQGNEARASTYLWIAGKDYIPWQQTNDRSFRLVADRSSYVPGDTAEILIASPFQGEAYALVTVERGHIRHYEVVKLESNSTIYKLPITAEMAPNVYLSLIIIKGVDDTNPRPDFKMSIIELKVDNREQALAVEVTPDRKQVGPGEQVTYNVHITDRQGRPVTAEVSLALSDLATLSLSEPNSPPILDYFYNRRGLSVWTSMPIVFDIEDYNAFIQEHLNEGGGMGSGGGKGDGNLGVIEVRGNFPDTAYWTARLVTDDNGNGSVTITLPDNLTTWRMDARAATLDTRVGQTTIDIQASKPLLVRPQTPRFFIAGDEARLGTAVQNNTDRTITVEVSLDAVGAVLQSDKTQQVDIPAKQQVFVTWNTTINMDTNRVDLVFSASGGGYSDASRPTMGTLEGQGIPVYRYEVPEIVGTSGQMRSGGTQVEAINIPPDMQVTKGELNIQIAPSLASGMTDGLTYLKEYPYGCIEQTISRFLPNVLTTKALRSAGLSAPDLEVNLDTQVNMALQGLYNWQNPDGGWGWWANQKSDAQTTAYVVLGLVEAKEAGYTVNEDVLSKSINYLEANLKPIRTLSDPSELNRQSFILYVLARASQPDVSRTVQIYDQRQAMALYARAYLAQTLYIINTKDQRIQTLLSDFNSAAILSATGTHWEEKETDYMNWNTDTRTTAIILSAVSVIDPTNPLNANAVRWLMSNRTDGHWLGTQETAWTLMALTNWMVASGELGANYDYAVAINGERIGGGTANRETLRQTNLLRVDISKMLTDGANRLAFARTDGSGTLYYTAHLNVSLPVEQVKALNQGIIVSRSYYRLDDLNTPVTQANQGELLLARLTVVAPNSLHYVMVDDPLPAGLEAVNQALETSLQSISPQEIKWDDLVYHGWGWWYFDHIELRDEKVILSASYLPAGTYVYTYLVRVSTPGTFRTIPPTALEFYFPEVYGRGDGSLFIVNP